MRSRIYGNHLGPGMMLDDRQIVAAVLADDRGIINDLFTHVVCAICLPVVQRSGFDAGLTADELASEVYVVLSADNWAKLREFRFGASLKTWLWAVTLRILLEKNRKLLKGYARQSQLRIAGFCGGLDVADDTASESVRAELLRENIQWVRSAMRRITNKEHRVVLQLRAIQRLSAKETAAILGKTPAHVDQIYARAKRKLKSLLMASVEGKGTI